MSQQPPPMAMKGPPYLPTTAQLGGRPVVKEDDVASIVLAVAFFVSAVVNMITFRKNLAAGRKFFPSLLLFAFCMARVLALSLRAALTHNMTNTGLGIAAGVFIAAGVVILFIINLIFAQRILRAYHPNFGWSRVPTLVLRFLFFCIVAMLIAVVTASVVGFYTIDPHKREQIRKVQLVAQTYLAVLAFLPAPIVLAAKLTPRNGPVDEFGQGPLSRKAWLVICASLLLTLGAGFRAGVAFEVRPITQPAWFHHKACFYIFNFGIELVVVWTYILFRVDKLFYIPKGCSKPGDYSAGEKERENSGGSAV